jgi:hypothetical protein
VRGSNAIVGLLSGVNEIEVAARDERYHGVEGFGCIAPIGAAGAQLVALGLV